MDKLVPIDFEIPRSLLSERFYLRMLTVNDVVKDYEAIMTSIEHLQKTMPFGPNHKWPTFDLTLEQNLIDLGWHQKEFQKRTSFAYTVMSLDENQCLGCVYIYPAFNSIFDAEIIMWVKQSEINNGFDEYLYETIKNWIKEKWPFKNPGYPGRDIDWQIWKNLK
jgi:hypothetical protein